MEGTVDKCLAFCQALVSANQKFTFTLSIGNETFKFDNKELAASSCVKKKKKSPSQIWREQRRREAQKLKIAEEVVVDVSKGAPSQQSKAAEKTAVTVPLQQDSTTLTFKCEQCEYTSSSDQGLKQHARMKHRISQSVAEGVNQAEVPPQPLTTPTAPRYQPPPMKCVHCDLYLPWFVMNWKGAQILPHHVCTCNP